MSDDKVTLDVELKANVAELVNSFEKLDKAGGFKNNSGGRAQLAAQAKHFKEIDFKNLSNKDLTAFAQEIQKFSNALLNAAKKMADPSVSKAIEKINTLISAAEKAVQSAQSKLESKTANVSLRTSKNGRASVLKALNEGTYDRKSLVFDNDTLFANLPDFLKRNKKGQLYTNKAYALQRTRELLADEDALKALPEKQRKQVYDYQDNWLGTDTKIPEKMKALANEIEKLAEDSQQAQLKLAALRAETQKIANSNSSDTGTKLVGDITKQSIDIQSGVRGLKDEKTVEQQQAKAAKESKENMDAATKSANKHSNAISNVVKQYFSWRIIGGLLRKAMNGVVQTIQELDKSLTEQAMVTGLTRDQTYGLIESYQALAKQTGATTTEVAAVVTEYLKQGESINDSLQLAEAAISSAKVARVSVSDSINYLTTALRGYRLEADQAMQVSDKFAALAAASATDYDELAIALSKVASQANLAGMSMDYTLALLTQGLETTREAPETMGTALKTIIARMRELTDYGKTLEGDADINTVESQLAYVGIDLRDDNGALRSTEEVLDELGRKWDKLNTNQQAALAKALAGTRQQSRLIALLDDYDKVLEFQQISLQSTGATAAQSATYLQGMEAAINNVQVAYEGLITSATDSEFLIGLVQTFANLLTNLNGLFNSLGGTITIVTVALAAWIAAQVAGAIANRALITGVRNETKEKVKNAGASVASAGASATDTAAKLTERGAVNGLTKALIKMNAAFAANPIGFVIMAALALIAVVGVCILAFADFRSNVEKVTESVNELSAEIYTLNQRAQAIEQVTDAVEELDNKLIKTKEDTEELNTQLEAVADKLSEEQQEAYSNLATKTEKLAFLEQVQAESIEEANQKRQEQLRLLKSLTEAERQQIWNGTDSASSNTRDAVRAIVNNDAYTAINAMSDLTSQESIDLQEITQSFLESADAATAYQWALEGVGSEIAELVSSARKIKTEDGEIAAFSVLNSSDYSLKEQVEAYEAIQDSLRGDTEALNAFNETYSQYETFQKMGDDVLDFIDKVDLTIDEINELWSAWEDLQAAGVNITQEQYEGRFENFMKTLTATGGDIASTVDMVFGDILAQFTEGTEEWEDAYNTFINSFADLVSVGILQTTQDMDSLMNTISNFYDKAGDWSTMSESDKGEFISDNADLFAGASGQELLKAFESGNYSAIQQALSSNEGLQDRLKNMRDQIDQELKIEEARVGDARNEAYIAQLKQYKAYLEDEENLFMASLEVRLEQEQDQLDSYKDYLEQRRDALQDELDKEKEAYQDYFDAVNQQEEAEDYEEQANLLITNISKLASSTNASSQSQMRDLTDQLEDLEEERLQTLRENAQQAVLDNIDDTIDEISDKFDDLLDSNQALLAAMTADMENPTSFVSGMIASQVSQGATALELEDYIQNLQSVYGASGIDLSGVSVSTDNNNNLILNVNGREYNLSSGDQQTVYEAIMKALTQIGLK